MPGQLTLWYNGVQLAGFGPHIQPIRSTARKLQPRIMTLYGSNHQRCTLILHLVLATRHLCARGIEPLHLQGEVMVLGKAGRGGNAFQGQVFTFHSRAAYLYCCVQWFVCQHSICQVKKLESSLTGLFNLYKAH